MVAKGIGAVVRELLAWTATDGAGGCVRARLAGGWWRAAHGGAEGVVGGGGRRGFGAVACLCRREGAAEVSSWSCLGGWLGFVKRVDESCCALTELLEGMSIPCANSGSSPASSRRLAPLQVLLRIVLTRAR